MWATSTGKMSGDSSWCRPCANLSRMRIAFAASGSGSTTSGLHCCPPRTSFLVTALAGKRDGPFAFANPLPHILTHAVHPLGGLAHLLGIAETLRGIGDRVVQFRQVFRRDGREGVIELQGRVHEDTS